MRFPKQHIASSVVNRILNVADELEADAIRTGALIRTSAPPLPTNPAAQSAELDEALDTPPPSTPPIDQAPDPGGSIEGRPLLSTLIDPEG